MEQVAIYFLKVNVGIIILFTAYLLILKNEKFFMLNRIFLLSILLFPFLLPLLPVFSFGDVQELQAGVTAYNPLNRIYTTIGSANELVPFYQGEYPINEHSAKTGFTFSWTIILSAGYVLITLIFLSKIILQVNKILYFIGGNKRRVEENICYCEHDRQLVPFSFAGFLVINSAQYSDEELKQIVAHEKVHIRQWHTFDILLVEILQAVLWINPVMASVKRHIKLNLEYIADEQALNTGIDKMNYQFTIVNNSVRHSSYPLTNLFNSSKLKLRIKMMNSNKSSARNLYKFLFVLPLVVAAYFAVNPVMANTADKKMAGNPANELKQFEGYYQFTEDKDSYIQILTKENHLVLKQLWDNKEITFEQKSDLEFYNTEHEFPLKFSKGDNGSITGVLAFSKDLWNKVKDYKPVVRKEILLPENQMKAYSGMYKLKAPQEAYLQFSVKGNYLLVKEMWSGKEILIAPESATDFFGKDMRYPVKFKKDAKGEIIEALIFDRDVWEKVKDYNPPKAVQLSMDKLNAFVGKYRFQFEKGKDAFILVTANENGLVFKQLWDEKQFELIPQSDSVFYSADRMFTVKFTINKLGKVTHALAFNKDLWEKV
jgi:hypothetical protein